MIDLSDFKESIYLQQSVRASIDKEDIFEILDRAIAAESEINKIIKSMNEVGLYAYTPEKGYKELDRVNSELKKQSDQFEKWYFDAENKAINLSEQLAVCSAERDELKAKLAELEQQEPLKLSNDVKKFIRESINEATQCEEADIDYEFAELLAQFLKPLYAEPKPSAPSQPITEQDAQKIIAKYLGEAIEEGQYFELPTRVKELLAKLNEHREPEAVKDNIWIRVLREKAIALVDACDRGSQDYLKCKREFIDVANDYPTNLSGDFPEKVTANKAEVPTLTAHEIDFICRVIKYPGCKLDGTTRTEDDGSEYGKFVADWKVPEQIGLVEAVGSYKWVPSKRVSLGLVVDGNYHPIPPLKDGE